LIFVFIDLRVSFSPDLDFLDFVSHVLGFLLSPAYEFLLWIQEGSFYTSVSSYTNYEFMLWRGPWVSSHPFLLHKISVNFGDCTTFFEEFGEGLENL
jgi:hypothetical protein